MSTKRLRVTTQLDSSYRDKTEVCLNGKLYGFMASTYFTGSSSVPAGSYLKRVNILCTSPTAPSTAISFIMCRGHLLDCDYEMAVETELTLIFDGLGLPKAVRWL